MSTNYKLVLVRHGESLWNSENRFTGWTDVGLSEKGLKEAKSAGELLKREGFSFPQAHTSYLKRAIKTLWIILEELDEMWIPVFPDWRLNERHYGELQGMNKAEMTKKYGEDQVFQWRRSYATPPPPLKVDDQRHPKFDPRDKSLSAPPAAESLKDTEARVIPYWNQVLVPNLNTKKQLLVVAHGNSFRALIKYLDHVPEETISELNIPTGIPLVYEFSPQLKPLTHYYLGDADEAKKKAEAVANQAKKK